jgi:CRP/FNR family transcriptional regulator, cyclic AMP receptor protein
VSNLSHPPLAADLGATTLESTLEQVFFLRGSAEEDRRELARLAICRHYPRGNLLFYHGDPCDSVFIVISGRVKLSLISDEGREMVLTVLGPTDVFGLVAALDAGPQFGTAIATSDCHLAKIPRDRFLAWFQQRPGLHHSVLAEMAAQLRRSYEKLGELALLPVKKRLYATLLEIARQEGRPAKGDNVVFERPTHQELAERVGSTRVVISRLLKELFDEEDDLTAQGKVIRLPLTTLVVRNGLGG